MTTEAGIVVQLYSNAGGEVHRSHRGRPRRGGRAETELSVRRLWWYRKVQRLASEDGKPARHEQDGAEAEAGPPLLVVVLVP